MKEETQSKVVRHTLAFILGFMVWAFASSFMYLGLNQVSPNEWLSNIVVFASYPLYHLIALRLVFSGKTKSRQGKGTGIVTAVWIGGLLVCAVVLIPIAVWRLIERYQIGFLGGLTAITIIFLATVVTAFHLKGRKL